MPVLIDLNATARLPCQVLARKVVGMDDKDDKSRPGPRRDPVSMVGPYARIRVIAAVIVFLIAIVVMAVRAFSA